MFLGLLWKRVFVKKGFVGDGVVMVAAHMSKIGRGGQRHDSDLANGPAHWECCQVHHLLPMVHWCRAGDLEPLDCGEETQETCGALPA